MATMIAQTASQNKPPIIKNGHRWGFEWDGYFAEFHTKKAARQELARLQHEAKSAFNRADTVTVYINPVTCTSAEGKAKLCQFLRTDGIFDYWKVQFFGDWHQVERKLYRGDSNQCVKNVKLPQSLIASEAA